MTKSFKSKQVVPTTTTKYLEEDETESASSGGDALQQEFKSSSSISIRTCSISMFLVIIFVCVLLLTIIWVAFFSSNVTEMSKSLTTAQFEKMIIYTERTFRDLVIASDAIKQQLIVTMEKNHSDIWTTEAQHTISNVYFSTVRYHRNFVNWAALHDRYGSNQGILFTPVFPVCKTVQVPNVAIYRYPCDILTPESGCIPKDLVNSINTTGTYNTDNAKSVIRKYPGQPMYTPSYVSPGIDATLILLVNSYASPNNSQATDDMPFDWFFTLDMSVENMSNFLKKATADILGSVAIIFETSTKYLIATSKPDVKVSGRISPAQLGSSEISGVYNDMVNSIPNFQDMSTNTFQYVTTPDRLTIVYRMQTEYNLDWIIIFSVPQWNYIGSMVIAIIIALSCSLIIAFGGVLSGIIYSLLIVKPFHNLIELFEHVACMDLDSLHVNQTRFTEVGLLQNHFLLMVQRIKQYRAFIPVHLLNKLDDQKGSDSTDHIQQEQLHAVGDIESHTNPTHFSSKLSASTLSKGMPNNYMFKIGFEKRKISFLMIYLDGFNYIAKRLSFHEITHLLTDIFEIIQKTCGSNAHIGNFENDCLTLSFNSTEKVKDHELKAVNTASTLKEKISLLKSNRWDKKESFEQNPKLLEKFSPLFAICTQNSHCGNVGTKTSKSFSIIGSASNNLLLLVKQAKKCQVSIVTTEHTNKDITSKYMTRFIAQKELIHEEVVLSPLVQSHQKKDKTKLYEIGCSTEVSMDEWMYELQSKESKNKWLKYNEGVQMFFNGNFKDSLAKLKEFSENNPEDKPALKLIKKCNKELK